MSSLLGGNKKEVSTTTSNSNPTLPSWLKAPMKDIISRGTELSNQAYTPYTGDRVAQLSGDETDAISMIRNLVGQAPADMQQSKDITSEVARRGLEGFSQQELQQYMNPYTENVLDVGRRRQFENYDKIKNDMMRRQGQSAAFGGSRSGLAEAQLSGDFQQQLSDYDTKGLYDSYNEGMNRAFQGTQLAGQSSMDLANIINMGQNSALQGINALSGAGAQQRGIEQRGLDVNYEDFLKEKAFPYEQLQFLSGLVYPASEMMRGQTSTSVNTQQTQGGSGILGAALGLGSMAMGIPGVSSALGLGSTGMGGLFGVGSSIGGAMGLGNQSVGVMDYLNPGARSDIGYANAGGYGPYRFKEGGQVPMGIGYADGGLVGKLSDFVKYMEAWNSGDEESALGMLSDLGEVTDPKRKGEPYSQEELQAFIDKQDQLDRIAMMNTGQLKPPGVTSSAPSTGAGLASLMDNKDIDLDLLARTIAGEARGEDTEGKAAVAAVIKNRADAKGKGIADIVMQPKQFSAWNQGDPNRDYMINLKPEDKEYQDALVIARGILEGSLKDPTGGATHYVNPDTASKESLAWRKKLNKVGDIGSHRFYVDPANRFAEGGLVNSKSKTPFQRLLEEKLLNPMSTAKENLGLMALKSTKGMEDLGQFFTQSEDEYYKDSPTVLSNLLESSQLGLAANKLERGQSPANLKKMMAQIGPLAAAGAEDVRMGPRNNLMVYPGETKKTSNPETQKMVADLIANAIANKGVEKPFDPSQHANVIGNAKAKGDFNAPLFKFGATLLGSDNGFFKAVGEAGDAYVTTKKDEEDRVLKQAKDAAELQMQAIKTALYGKSIAAQTNPWTQKLKQLQVQKMQKELTGVGDYGKLRDMIYKQEMTNASMQGLPVDSDTAMQKATKLAMSLTASGVGGAGEEVGNTLDINALTEDDLAGMDDTQLQSLIDAYGQE